MSLITIIVSDLEGWEIVNMAYAQQIIDKPLFDEFYKSSDRVIDFRDVYNPRDQVKLARKLYETNKPTLIITASDYFCLEVNNLCVMHDKQSIMGDVLSKYGYKAKELLDHKVVSVYEVYPKRKKPLVKAKYDNGFILAWFDDVIDRQNAVRNDTFLVDWQC